MPDKFTCPTCGAKVERLVMRDSDGKYVCHACVPAKEWKELHARLKEAQACER
jgi:DNA polymerase II large subunit